jgi:HAMP domain-containing protein
MTHTITFAAGLIFGVGLMLALWKWVDARMDADDRRDIGE